MKLNPHLEALECVRKARDLAMHARDLEELHHAMRTYDAHPIVCASPLITGRYGDMCQRKEPLMVLGKSPAATETERGLPYQGKAATLLRECCEEAGFDLEQTYQAYATCWRPERHNDPKATQIAFSRPFLRREIEFVSPRAIVVLGAKASDALMGGHPDLEKEAGVVMQVEGVRCHFLRNHGYIMRFPQSKAEFVRMLAEAWTS